MDMLQYQQEAQNTKSSSFDAPYRFIGEGTEKMTVEQLQDILHASIGIATEAGEFLDPFKKAMFYGKHIDLVNLDEEVGDLLWYIAIYAEARGKTIPELASMNNRKLKQRFPDKFTQEAALNRDLFAERQVLEEG